MTETETEILEGISGRSTKDEMMKRLQAASRVITDLRGRLQKKEEERLTKLQEIEQRVKEKYADRPTDPVQNVIVSSTVKEWEETIEFLEEFDDPGILPTPLQRLLVGGKVLLGQTEEEEAVA